MPKLEPPEDKTITTLYVGNLGEKITEKELKYVGSFKNLFLVVYLYLDITCITHYYMNHAVVRCLKNVLFYKYVHLCIYC